MSAGEEGVDILGDVRDLLAPLERSAAAPGLASTTIGMAAVAAGEAEARPQPGAGRRGWVSATALVGAALLAGFAAGRGSAPDPDESTLRYLPVVEHVDVLHEAGSVAFLDAISVRQYPAPRPFPFARQPESRGEEAADPDVWPQLDETVEALRAGPFGPETPAAEMVGRRERIEDMDDEELRLVADRATVFHALPRATSHELIELARELAESDDARRDTLLAAARTWHRWIAWSDPADRQSVVALGLDDRLEWLDRRARMAFRGQWSPGRPFTGGRGGDPFGQGRRGRDERRDPGDTPAGSAPTAEPGGGADAGPVREPAEDRAGGS